MLSFFFRWVLLGTILIGHVAFWCHWFNRINATGISRPLIKKIELLIVGLCFLLPVIAIYNEYSWLSIMLSVIALGYILWQGPAWIRGRIQLRKSRDIATLLDSHRLDMKVELGSRVFAATIVRVFGNLPFNEIHWIESRSERICLPGLPPALTGLRIGHFSDIHLTAWMDPEYYHRAIACLVEQKPDIVVFSGDLVDYEKCLSQVQPLLEPIHAPYGCFFVLGNHDRHLPDVERLRSSIVELGWHDLGKSSRSIEVRGEELYFIGNERPWFDPPERQSDEVASEIHRKSASLRIGVSHSPDQFSWAKSLGLELLFCGHNHGGQVQIPWLGPLVAPSYFGSRYAGGWFDEPPTMMRVSRGLSGTQPIRFRCPPEVAVVRIDSMPTQK